MNTEMITSKVDGYDLDILELCHRHRYNGRNIMCEALSRSMELTRGLVIINSV